MVKSDYSLTIKIQNYLRNINKDKKIPYLLEKVGILTFYLQNIMLNKSNLNSQILRKFILFDVQIPITLTYFKFKTIKNMYSLNTKIVYKLIKLSFLEF